MTTRDISDPHLDARGAGSTSATADHGTATVEISALAEGDSPRLGGLDMAHVRLLAERVDVLPPVLVHRPYMRVVDGRHRVAAARSRGLEQVPVRWFEGSDDEAFVTAVRLNASHGLPLAGHERAAAVQRILASHQERSDRWIASVCGVAPRTVAALRARTAPEGAATPGFRIGQDGRRRPLSARAGRERAREIMVREPEASLRTVARRAGISVGTALDVRRRLAANPENAPAPAEAPADILRPRLEQLLRDPSLRYNDQGRTLLRLATSTLAFMERPDSIAQAAAGHSRESLQLVARACAEGWQRFGAQVADESARQDAPGIAV
ncbi:ParB N-terminal domain-containing protein [Streptomyces sp. GMY02]|uniref:ParB/RepB/Spo0J family partition protein n=1 Tax=Streptomyces sp. GMY02 TaxID=1333528 RepID=UPI001C2C0736|nr:ParB N-terminal domain-containing protein [Streptomyces sp. GMY02]QXE35779.1 ParB N-terminal domain-containing protein [Streptomyces sp. GMY02]